MAFFVKDKGLTKDSKYGRVYVLRITLDTGKVVHKVGMTYSDRSMDRMMEILRSFFITYRYVPRCELRRDKKVLIPRLVEQYLHNRLDDLSYTFNKKFDGSTEFFMDLDEDSFLRYLDDFKYNELLDCVVLSEKDLTFITEAINSSKPPKDSKLDIIPF